MDVTLDVWVLNTDLSDAFGIYGHMTLMQCLCIPGHHGAIEIGFIVIIISSPFKVCRLLRLLCP